MAVKNGIDTLFDCAPVNGRYYSSNPTGTPTAPTLGAPVVDSDSQITIHLTGGVYDSLTPQRSPAGAGAWTSYDQIFGPQTTYSFTGLTPSTEYEFRFIAGANAQTANTATATETTDEGNPVPDSPTGASATALSASQIRIDWTDASDNETGFSIERSNDGSTGWAEIATTLANVETYTDTGLAASTQRYYRVSAFNDSGPSAAATSVVNATTNAAPSGQRTVTPPSGQNFGSGPTVVFFDRAEGTDNTAYSLTADIGEWAGVNLSTAGTVNDVRYFAHGGRTWLGGRQRSNLSSTTAVLTSMRYEHPSVYEEFYREYRMVIPTGYKYPGAATANEKDWNDTDSRLKILWGWIRAYGAAANTDCCYPSTIPSATLQVLGNAVQPRWLDGATERSVTFSMTNFSAVNDNILGYYVSGNASTTTSFDATIELFQFNGDGVTRTTRTTAHHWRGLNNAALPEIGEDTFVLPAWQGNINSSGTLHCYADIYQAVGANARARIYTHNAATLAASTDVRIVPPDSWSSSAISFTPVEREDLQYVTIIKADGTAILAEEA